MRYGSPLPELCGRLRPLLFALAVITAGPGIASGQNPINVPAGSTYDLNGQNLGSQAFSIAGTGTNGIGALINSSTATALDSGTIALTGNSSIGAGQIALSGVISGTGYSLTKSGANGLVLSGSNSYTGGTIITGGTLSLSGSTGMLASSTNGITVGGGATLQIDDSTILTTGSVSKIANQPVALLSGSLVMLGSGSCSRTETTGAVTFSGGSGISVHQPQDAQTLGLANLTRIGNGTLQLGGNGSGLLGTGADCIITSTANWPANVVVNGSNAMTNPYYVNGYMTNLSGTNYFVYYNPTYGFTNTPYSSATLSASSNFTQVVNQTSGVNLSGSNFTVYALRASAPIASGTVTDCSGGLIFSATNTHSASFICNTGSSDNGTPVEMVVFTPAYANVTLTGGIGGANLTKFGSGKLNLSNSSTMLSGTIGVNDGALVISDSIPSVNPILVNSGTGALCGTGTVSSPVSIASGVLAPGNPAGALTLTGSLTLSSSATLAISVTGTAPGQWGQIAYGGTSSPVLAGSLRVNVSGTAYYAPGTSGSFTIISSSAPVTGTFQGLPEGAQFAAGNYWWQITYHGNAGNDVVISIQNLYSGAVIDPTVTGTAIPRGFAGFSLPYTAAPVWFGSPASGSFNPGFANLVNNLTNLEGPPVMRVGPDADFSWYQAEPYLTEPNFYYFCLENGTAVSPFYADTPSIYQDLAYLRDATGSQFTLTVNFAGDNASAAIPFIEGAEDAFEPGAILAFDIGNEPDNYDNTGTHQLFRNPLTWTASTFLADFENFLSGTVGTTGTAGLLTQAGTSGLTPLPLAGPAYASREWYPPSDSTDFDNFATDMAAIPGSSGTFEFITTHNYGLQQSTVVITASTSLDYWAQDLLGTAITDNIFGNFSPVIAAASSYGFAVRMNETNSITGGISGICNGMAGGLWALDALGFYAKAGFLGANFHNGLGFANSPGPYNGFTVTSGTNNGYSTTAQAVYYGMYFFSEFIQNGAELMPATGTGTPSVDTFASKDSGGALRVLVVNKNNRIGVMSSLNIVNAGQYNTTGTWTIFQVSGTAGYSGTTVLTATSGFTVGGQSFDNDGNLTVGTPANTAVIGTGTGATLGLLVSLPPGSAGILTLAPLTPVSPTVTMDKSAQTVQAGEAANVTATAAGSAPFTYQWYFNSNSQPVTGATNAHLFLPVAMTSSAGNYYVQVSNTAGTVTGPNFTLTVNVDDINVPANQTYDFQGQNVGPNEAFTVAGYGYGGEGALISSIGTGAACSGPVTLMAATALGGGGAISLSGPIVGGYSLIKVGSNLITLSGANTYSGATLIDDGVLQFDSPASIGGTGQSVFIGPEGAAALGYTGIESTFLNRIASDSLGTVALTQNSSENIDFSGAWGYPPYPYASLGATGAVVYTGTLTPYGGVYRLGGGGGTLTLSNPDALTGACSLVVAGLPEALVVLGASNNYTGSTTVNSSILEIGIPGAVPPGNGPILVNSGGAITDGSSGWQSGLLQFLANASTGAVVLTANSGGSETLNFASANLPNVSLGAVSGTIPYSGTLTPANGTYRFGGAGGTISISGPDMLTGTCGVVVGVGSGGNLNVTGTQNYTGQTIIDNGTLDLTGSFCSFKYSSSPLTVNEGGTLVLDDSITDVVSTTTLSGSQSIALAGGSIQFLGGSGTSGAGSYSRKLSVGALTFSGGSKFFISQPVGGDTFFGVSNIGRSAGSYGTLQIGWSSGLGNPIGTLYSENLQVTLTGNVPGNVVVNGTTGLMTSPYYVDGTTDSFMYLQTGVPGFTDTPFNAVNLTGNKNTSSFVVDQWSPYVLTSSTTVYALRAEQPISGNYTVTVRSGGMILSGSSSLTGQSIVHTANYLCYNGTSNVEAVIYVDQPSQVTLDGTLTASSLTKFGEGILTLGVTPQLSSSGQLTPQINVNDGTLQLAGPGMIPGGLPVMVFGTLDLNGYGATLASLSGPGMVTSNTQGAVSVSIANGDGSFNNPIFTGVFEDGLGTLSLTYSGTGTFTLASANLYSGSTSINSGRLLTAVPYAIPMPSTVNVTGTLDTDGMPQTFDALNGTGTVTNNGVNSATLTIGNYCGSGVFSGAIASGSSTVSLVKTGTGQETLSGVCNCAAGASVVAGTLDVTGTINGAVVVAGGELTGAGAANGPVTVTSGTVCPGLGAMFVNGVYTIGAAGTYQVVLNGTSAGSYSQVIASGSAIALSGSLNVDLASGLPVNSQFTIIRNLTGQAVAGMFAGLGQGTVFSAGGYGLSISYTGGAGNDVVLTILSAGNPIIVNSGSTYDFAGGNLGSQPFIIAGTGSGGIGALMNSGATGASDSGTVVLSGNASIGSGQITLSGPITGAYSLTKSGTNILVLSGSNSYTGGTIISSGTLSLSGTTGALATSTNGITVGGGGTLLIDDSSVAVGGTGSKMASQAVNLVNGGIMMLGGSDCSRTEIVGPVTFNGASDITVTRPTYDQQNLLPASLTRVGNGTMQFVWQGIPMGQAGAPCCIISSSAAWPVNTVVNGTNSMTNPYYVDATLYGSNINHFMYYNATYGFADTPYSAATLPASSSTLVVSQTNAVTLSGSNAVYALRSTANITGGAVTVYSGGLILSGTAAKSAVIDSASFICNNGTKDIEMVVYTPAGTGTTTLTGGIEGTNLTKFGGGMLNLSNTSTVLSGTIGVNDGALVISDTISGSIPILVNSGTGALCGAGTANGPVTIASGVLAPGFPTGALTLNGNLTLSANSTLAIAVTGTAAGQYGQIVYGGTSASISGALTVSAPAGLQPETSFTIISSSTAVTGTFQGLPQNAYFYAAGYTWQINYSGGSGDNVVISIVGTGQEQQEKAIRAPDALAASSRAEAKTPSAKDASSGADRTDATGEGEAVPAVSISEIGETVARVDALVGARNSMTKVFFRYGPDLAYGKTSGTATLEAGGSASSVSMDLSALAPHTVYHIRCIAKGPRGTSVSPDVVFKTLPRFDMNGTGYSDILLSDSTGATTVLFIGNKVDAGGLPAITGTESAAGPWIPPGLSYRGEAEFYRNGTVGLIVTGSTPRQTELLTSGTDGWESAPLLTGTFAAPDTATVAGVGYFNGDGNPGLLLVGANRKLTFWRLDGLTVTAQKEGPALSPGFVVAGLDNLSGSENPEILIWNPETGITEVLTMKGTEVTSIEVGPTIPPGWQLMGDNDFTNAGTANWLLYNPASRATVIWTMQGARIRSVAPGPGISDGFAPLGTE